jgi:hypothetical protein
MYVYMYTCMYVIYIYHAIYVMRWNNPCLGLEMHKSAQHRREYHVGRSEAGPWCDQNVANPWASKCIQAHCPLNGNEKVLTHDYGQWIIIHVEQDWTPKKVDRWGKPKIKIHINHPNLTLQNCSSSSNKPGKVDPGKGDSRPPGAGFSAGWNNRVTCPQEWAATVQIQGNGDKQHNIRTLRHQ